jgi:hypothetical protein
MKEISLICEATVNIYGKQINELIDWQPKK